MALFVFVSIKKKEEFVENFSCAGDILLLLLFFLPASWQALKFRTLMIPV